MTGLSAEELCWYAFIDKHGDRLSLKQINAIEAWLKHAPAAWLADPNTLAAKMVEAGHAIGLASDVIADAYALTLDGPRVVADALSGQGRPLTPELHLLATGEELPAAERQDRRQENAVEDDRLWYRELMETDRFAYDHVKMANGKTPQENYAALLEHEQVIEGALPAAGKYADQGTFAIEHKPQFVMPTGMTEAPGFRSFARIGEGEPLKITMKETRP